MNAAGRDCVGAGCSGYHRIGFLQTIRYIPYSCSENKERILIYKRQVRNDYLTVATRLFNQDFQQLDSSRQLVKYDDRRDFYSELVVDNNGDFLFARERARVAAKKPIPFTSCCISREWILSGLQYLAE